MSVPHAHRMTVRVRYPEVDGGGRVHHSVYLVYFEMGRTELLRERGIAYAHMEADGRFLAISQADVRYCGAAGYDDELVVETWVERVRGARVVFGNRCLRAGDESVVAEATITGALVDASGRPIRFSKDEIARLSDAHG